jgi:hypothetical protein
VRSSSFNSFLGEDAFKTLNAIPESAQQAYAEANRKDKNAQNMRNAI